jgi:hypothetical protein
LKYLYEEIESLQSLCLTLDFLYKYWLDAAAREGEVQNPAGVSTIDDLFLLREEFGVQMKGREELVKRLNNVQNLVRALADSRNPRPPCSSLILA